MQADRDIALTGPGRSGTTLTCHLLNKLPDAVALAEPIAPRRFKHPLSDTEAVCDSIEHFYRKMRKMALQQGIVRSKHVGGVIPDNTKAVVNGVRQRVAEKGEIPVGKELRPGFYLAIKHPGMFTALLPALIKRMPCYAIVRNPLPTMASLMTLPERSGPPASSKYDPEIGARWEGARDHISRLLTILDYHFERYAEYLPPERVVRYEEIVSSGGRVLDIAVPSASSLDEPLESKNLNPLYDRDEMLRLGEKLLASEGAYWRFYTPQSVERLLAAV